MNNTNENNKLIAQFMQLELISNKEYEIKRKDMIKQNIAYDLPLTLDDLKYHSSWDWLMPVVMKISRKIDKPIDEVVSLLTEVGSDNIWDIKSFYNAIVEFIKEYNN
tara:strand:+ start:287 stop:607 length:321 start_codon:yes stop_codon:yes gene_type:complete